jgi:hypothetical protein
MLQGGRNLRKKKQEVETQAQTVSTLGLDQINKFGLLGEGNLHQSNSECVYTGKSEVQFL